MDAAELKFDEAFDAAFSNAALHWMLDKERVARAIFRALKPGGRFAGEMGGEGNLATAARGARRRAGRARLSGRRPMTPMVSVGRGVRRGL